MKRNPSVTLLLIGMITGVLFLACGGGESNDGGDVLTFVEPAYFVSVDDPAADDSNPGTMDSPFAGIQAAIDAAAAAYSTAHVYVAEGDYLVSKQLGTHIVLAERISVHGGYAADWTDRNQDLHPTQITDTSTTGGVSLTPNCAVDAGSVTEATTIDGFDINGGAGTYSTGIYVNESSPTISGNYINGGSGAFSAVGVAIFNSSPAVSGNMITGGTNRRNCVGIRIEYDSAPVIEGNVIDAGAGADNIGINQRSSLTVTIRSNSISGGAGSYEAIGLYNETDSTPVVEDNLIEGGSAEETYGIWNYHTGSFAISGNTIDGGSGHYSQGIYSYGTSLITIEANVISGGSSSFCYGVYETEDSANDIRNNLIYGGDGTLSTGVFVWEGSPIVRNNTIDSGSASNAYGIYFSFNSEPVVENNIIMGPGTGYGIIEGSVASGPATVNNNDIFGFSYAFVDQDSGCGGSQVCSIAQMEALADMTASGNVSLDPVLEDIDGSDDDPATMEDNLWALTAGSPSEVTEGGLDLSGEYTGDFSGATRTVPWSMGAYEYD